MLKKILALIVTFGVITISWMWTNRNQVILHLADSRVDPILKESESTEVNTPLTHSQKQIPLISQTTIVQPMHKIEILKEIFRSKNDNDPRLDQDFNQLSDDDKRELSKQYDSLSLESRNERGTIVYLLGKNLSNSRDFEFLQKVVTEKPCLSLLSCNSVTASSSNHEDSSSEITLHYPQIVALKSIEAYLKQNPNSPDAHKVLQEAQKSRDLVISQMAYTIRQKTNRSDQN